VLNRSWIIFIVSAMVASLGCGNRASSSGATAAVSAEALQPTDGRRMGIARFDDEKCEAIYNEVTKNKKPFGLSNLSVMLKTRMPPPDGVRPDGEVYWLAVDKGGACNEYVADTDGSIGHGSLNARECGLPNEAKPTRTAPSSR
jgi:hypothetical protein